MKPVLKILLILFNINFIWAYEVIYAINAGGPSHMDEMGIEYDEDPLEVGQASDYGKKILMMGRVSQADEILYQTERYHTSTFGYDIPLDGDGTYMLVLKFCEVYFNAPNQKVFDVILNDDHIVISDLDIFGQVGRGVAHDEYIQFSVNHGKLYYKEEESDLRGQKSVKVEFIKGQFDNPKVNAIILLKGDDVDNFPRLNPLVQPDEVPPPANLFEDQRANDDFDEEIASPPKYRKTSGPKQEDPYSMYDSSVMIPVFVAIAAFIPLLYFLCKL